MCIHQQVDFFPVIYCSWREGGGSDDVQDRKKCVREIINDEVDKIVLNINND
jgi:hypothetical protein